MFSFPFSVLIGNFVLGLVSGFETLVWIACKNWRGLDCATVGKSGLQHVNAIWIRKKICGLLHDMLSWSVILFCHCIMLVAGQFVHSFCLCYPAICTSLLISPIWSFLVLVSCISAESTHVCVVLQLYLYEVPSI